MRSALSAGLAMSAFGLVLNKHFLRMTPTTYTAGILDGRVHTRDPSRTSSTSHCTQSANVTEAAKAQCSAGGKPVDKHLDNMLCRLGQLWWGLADAGEDA